VGKLAFSLARQDSEFWERLPLSSGFTALLSREALLRHGGERAVREFEDYLNSPPLLPLDPAAARFLSAEQNWGAAPPGCEHVFGQRRRAPDINQLEPKE
jgi:hypothetical protein